MIYPGTSREPNIAEECREFEQGPRSFARFTCLFAAKKYGFQMDVSTNKELVLVNSARTAKAKFWDLIPQAFDFEPHDIKNVRGQSGP